jgi:hypothetical protein
MKFKNLTEEQKNYLIEVYHDKNRGSFEKRAIEMGQEFGVSERTIRKWWSEKMKLKEKADVESEQYVKAKNKKFNKNKKRFIITYAQNATKIHDKFFNNIKAYSEFIDADIHVIAGRYRNPTSIWSTNQESDEWWDENVLPYLDANRHDIHKYVSILSDIKIHPTAVNPMTGMQALSGINSCVFGSPKVQLEMIPVLEGNKPKMMVTTGAVTKKNYTDSKAGKKGEFHHTFGFVIVEIKDNDTFFIRQVTADDKSGDFTDLYYKVSKESVTKVDSIAAIVLGDIHFGHHDQEVLDSTMELLDKVTPTHVVLHDVFDGNSISHHEMKDPFIQYGKEVNGTNDLKKEVDEMLDGLAPFEKFKNVVIVRSNHDDFLDRWLKNEDWKKQPTYKNSRLYMKYSDILLEQYGEDPYNVKGVIPTLINERYPKFKTLGRSASYLVKGFELGTHGDIGANGSRGSLLQFRKLNTKIIVGHYHSPGRKDGALSVGTSTHLRVGYNKGASSWLQSHVLIHTDGRAQHINFIRDKEGKVGFTTFEY